MTNISTATRAELRETLRTMRAENLDVSKQLDLIHSDIIGMDPVTLEHNGGNTDPDQVTTIRAGRLMVRCLAKNAARTAAKLRSACRTPSTRQHVGARVFPKFEQGMSTAEYVAAFETLNQNAYGEVNALPYNLTNYLAPCTLYEGGALDFDAIEEPIDAPERTEPEPTRTPEPMVQIVSGLTGAYLGLLPKSAAHAMAQRHGNTIGTPAPADYTITAARYSKTGTMVIKTHSPDGYSTRASRLAATFGRYSHRQGGYTVTAKAAARFSAMYAAGWDGSYISDKAADRKPPAANQTAEAARQVSELIASATTAAALQAEPLSQDQAAALQQHGKDWDGRELCGYYLSEKLDGCRAYWDGSNLYTKTGNRIDAPTITATLPAGFALDGEIYAGRGRFEDARLFVQYGKNPERVQFIAFDAPGLKNKDWPLRLNEIRAHGVPCVDCVQAYTMADVLHALRAVLEAGGEGLMARIPSSEYKPGRSSNLMKLKQHSMAYFSDVPELETVTSEPDALATTCDASSAGNAGSAPTHGRASSAAHLAPQRATHDAHGQRLGQHVSGHSGNWRAVMFRDDCGRPAFEFEGQDGSREVWSFETGRERMAALQAMAREADDAADQSNDASDADQPPAEQAGIESIKDAIRINEREMERVLKSKQKGSKESAYRIELIISELADKLSDALKASKSTTTTGEYQQPAPVPKTETEADTKAADKVPRAVVLDSGQQSTSGTDTADEVPRAVTQGTRDNTAQAAPTVSELVALLQARGFHGVESRRRPGAVLLARRGNDYPLTYSNTTQAQRCIAKLAAAGVAASVRGSLVVVTGAMQPPAGAARTVRDIMPTDGEHISDPAGRWEAWITGTEPRACVLFYRADAFRPTYHYSYKTTDKAREALRRFADEAEAIATERDNRKAERRAKLDQPHGLAVGDVLRSSWGYDQTNTDYFEVTRVIGKRTVEVRKLAEQIEQTAWAQGNSVPVPGKYVGAPMRRQVDTQGAVNILHATYGRAYKMEPVATVAGVRCFSPSGWSSYA